METVRDSAFGKLVRVCTKQRYFRYPEETDHAAWKQYLKAIPIGKSEGLPESGFEGEALFTTRSQALRVQRSRSDGIEVDLGKLEAYKTSGQTKIVHWRDESDSENPQNWSYQKKVFVSIQIWLLTFVIYIGSAIYSPGIPGVAEEFNVSQVAATVGLTTYVAGYGCGPMVWSPLSELPVIGRSPVYVLTLFAFIWLNFGISYTPNYGCLIVMRFITGFIGSPSLATGAASMGDIWSTERRDYMIIIWGAFAIAAPVLGPLVGGFAYMSLGWRWTIWPFVIASAAVFILLFFCLPETYAPNILARRAARIRKLNNDTEYQAEAEKEMAELKPRDVIFEALVRPFQLCFTEPIVFIMNLYVAMIYGILYIWFEAYPIVFEEIHGFNSGESGCAFLGILVGTAVTVPLYFWWKIKYQSRHLDKNQNMAPEHQLPAACLGSLLLPVSLFWFGWTGNYESVHWIIPIIASIFFSAGGCLIFNSIFTYQAAAYPEYAASVLAGNDFLRSSFGAGFPLFATAMFHNLGVNWACTLLGCLTICFVPFPFVLYKWGKKIRMASKYANHDI